MDNNELLKCSIESKLFLEGCAKEERSINFTTLKRRVSAKLDWKPSYECFWRSLAIVNRQSWTERKILLTVIVRCENGLPGLRFWVQAKNLGAIGDLPQGYIEQKHYRDQFVKTVFASYAIKESI